MPLLCLHCGQPVDPEQPRTVLLGTPGTCPRCGQAMPSPSSRRTVVPPRSVLPPGYETAFEEPPEEPAFEEMEAEREEASPAIPALVPIVPPSLPKPSAFPDEEEEEPEKAKSRSKRGKSSGDKSKRTKERKRKWKWPFHEEAEDSPKHKPAVFGGRVLEMVLATGLAALLMALFQRTPDPDSFLGWLPGVLVVVAGLAGVLALLVGALAIFVDAPFWAIFVRSYTIIVPVLALVLSAGKVSIQKTKVVSNAQEALSGAADTLGNLVKEMRQALWKTPTLPGSGARPSDNPVADGNDLEKAQKLSKGLMDEIADMKTDYQTELDNAGLPKLLDPNRIALDVNFGESYAIIDKSKAIIEKYETRATKLLNDAPQRLFGSSFDGETRNAIMDGLKAGLQSASPMIKETWTNEQNRVNQMGQAILLLEARDGHWLIEDGKFLFDNPDDLREFDEIMEKVANGAKQSTETRESALKNALDAMRKHLLK